APALAPRCARGRSSSEGGKNGNGTLGYPGASRGGTMNHGPTRRPRIAGAPALAPTAAATGLAAAAPAASQAGTSQDLRKSVAELVAAGAPGATILIRDGNRATVVARGLADTKAKKPMRPADTFRIGSLTKTYAAQVV